MTPEVVALRAVAGAANGSGGVPSTLLIEAGSDGVVAVHRHRARGLRPRAVALPAEERCTWRECTWPRHFGQGDGRASGELVIAGVQALWRLHAIDPRRVTRDFHRSEKAGGFVQDEHPQVMGGGDEDAAVGRVGGAGVGGAEGGAAGGGPAEVPGPLALLRVRAVAALAAPATPAVSASVTATAAATPITIERLPMFVLSVLGKRHTPTPAALVRARAYTRSAPGQESRLHVLLRHRLLPQPGGFEGFGSA